MAMYRRSKRKTGGKRKAAVRRPRRRNIASKVHSFKRSVYVPNWINTLTIGDTAFNFNPQLTDVPDHTEFTKLFDQYRISGASFKLVPRWNVTQSLPTGTIPGLPPSQVMTCFDFDGNGPTTLQAILQYQNLKMTRGTSVHQRYLKPATLAMAYETTVSTAYVPKWNQFIDTANDAVPHYGLYGIIPNIGVTYSYDLYATYYIQCKNVR